MGNLKNREDKNLNKTGMKRNCMDSSSGKCLIKLIRLSKSNLKIGTEALLCAGQKQAIKTNCIKHHIDKTSERPLCRLCGKEGESVQHLVNCVRNWLRKNIRDEMLQKKSIGAFL